MTSPIRNLLNQWALHRVEPVENLSADIKRVCDEISRLAPESTRILELQYCDPRPQKAKAAMLRMSRHMFSARLRWIHQQLEFSLREI